MTKYKAKGTVVAVGETRTSGSGFVSRRFIVDTTENPAYRSPVEFTLKKDRCGDIDGYKPGETVEVEFSIDGRRWDGPNGTRYFTDLTVWHICRLGVVPSDGATGTPAVKTAQDAFGAWKEHHGEDKAGFRAFCNNLNPGKKSSEYTSADWGEVVAKLEEEAKAEAGDDFDDMPF